MIYPPIDFRLPPMAPRTRLYHLEPIGVGTPEVESLTGYMMRLAEAHCVTTSALVTGELLPAMKPHGLGSRPAATWLGNHGPHFNGTGDTAREAVAALTDLTGYPDLGSLTLRPWAQVLAPHGLLRLGKHPRVWCSACYAESLARGTPLYEQLLWTIAVVVVCPRHQQRLSERCPYADCSRVLPAIAARARPGQCSWCQRVLDRRGDERMGASESTVETGWNLWVAQQIGALLALPPPGLAVPSPATVLAALDACIRTRCESGPGMYGLFAHRAGVAVNRLIRWRKGHVLPTIDLLLRVCLSLGMSPRELLLADTSGVSEEAHPVAVMAPQRKPRLPPASWDADQLRQAVATLPTSDVPLSVAETARRLGCSSAVLFRLCPDTYRAIADRYQAYRVQQRDERRQHLTADIRQVIRQFDTAGIYPASKRVRALLQRRVHPRNSDYNRIRRQLLQEFGWNTDGTRIPQDQSAEPDRTCNPSLH